MKKIIIWILGISLISLGIGLALSSHYGGYKLNKRTIDLSKTASIDSVDLITITSSSADIIITPTDQSQISLRYFGELSSNGKNDPAVEINKIGTGLNIKSGMPMGFMWYNMANFDKFKLEIQIPATYQKRIEIKSNTGNLEISSLKFGQITATTSGIGKINISNCEGEQTVSTTGGEIRITDSVLTANKDIKTNSGEVNLFLPANANFNYVYDTELGNITNLFPAVLKQNDEKHVFGIVGDGKTNISVETRSGNLNIGRSN